MQKPTEKDWQEVRGIVAKKRRRKPGKVGLGLSAKDWLEAMSDYQRGRKPPRATYPDSPSDTPPAADGRRRSVSTPVKRASTGGDTKLEDFHGEAGG